MFEDLLINIRVNRDGVRDGINDTSSALKGLKNSMSGLNQIIGAGKMYALADGMAKAVKSTLDMTETVNLFNVSMGDMAVSSGESLKHLSEISGLDLTNLQSAVGTYSLLARSMGMTTEQSAKLGLNTTKLAIDLSSLTNVPIDRVMQDLRSGLLGQSETVYKYGMDVTEAGLKAEAMNQGIQKSVRDMSQGEKMALRYSVMIHQSGLAQGDFANTINTGANQLRILHERFITLGRSIGSIFIPMIYATLPYLNAFIQILIEVANAIAHFFGFKAPDVANTVKTATAGVGAIGTGLDNTTGKAGKTTKALKEMKNALMGFDEINLLPSQTPSADAGGGAGAGGGIGGGGGLGDLANMKLPDMTDFFSKIHNISDDIKTKMIPILKEVLVIVGLIGLAFLSWKIAGGIIEMISFLKALRTAMAFVEGAEFLVLSERASKLVPILEKAKIAMAEFWVQFQLATGIFAIIGGLIIFFKGIYDILNEATPSLKAFGEALLGIALVVGGVFLVTVGWIPALIVAIVLAVGLLATYMYKYWDDIVAYTTKIWNGIAKFFTDLWVDIVKGVSDMCDSVKKWFTDRWTDIVNFITITVPKLISDIITWFDELPNKLAYALGFALGSVVKWGIDVGVWIATEVPKMIEAVRKFFADLPAKIGNEIAYVKNTIETWVKNAVKWVADEVPKVISAVVGFFSGIPAKVKTAIDDVKSTISTWATNCLTWFNTELPKVINGVIGWFAGLPDKIATGIHNMYTTIKGIGTYLLDGLIDGMMGYARKVQQWGSSFVQGFKDALGIHSPSRVMRDEVGTYLGQGIMVGLEGTTKGIIDTASGISDGIQGAFSDVSLVPTMGKLMASPLSAFGTANFTGNVNGTTTLTADNSDFTNAVYDSVLKAMSTAMGSDNSQDLVLNVNGTEFGRVAINTINKITKQEGRLALNI